MHHSPIFRVYIIVVDGCTAGLERAIEYKTKLRYKVFNIQKFAT